MLLHLMLCILLLLTGCTLDNELPERNDADMADRRTLEALANLQRMQWGQRQTFNAPWQENEARPLLTLDRQIRPFPVSKTVILSLEDTSPVVVGGDTYIFRWRMTVGVGGGASTLKFDASRLQQIALPAETIRLELLCENPRIEGFTGNFDSPGSPVYASAFVADMPVASSQASYSQHASVANGGGVETIPVPVGASGLLIGPDGLSASTQALAATCSYELLGNSGTINAWLGTDLTPLSARIQPIPVPGAARGLQVTNDAVVGDAVFWAIWLLDL